MELHSARRKSSRTDACHPQKSWESQTAARSLAIHSCVPCHRSSGADIPPASTSRWSRERRCRSRSCGTRSAWLPEDLVVPSPAYQGLQGCPALASAPILQFPASILRSTSYMISLRIRQRRCYFLLKNHGNAVFQRLGFEMCMSCGKVAEAPSAAFHTTSFVHS